VREGMKERNKRREKRGVKRKICGWKNELERKKERRNV